MIAPGAVSASNPAVTTDRGERLSYQQLATAADTLLPASTEKELVVLVADNSLTALIAYLACWRSDRAVMLQPADISDDALQALLARYQPKWLIDPRQSHEPQPQPASSAAALHPALAVLLSTSGSTGSPKLVRLSRHNIIANAQAIAQYLQLNASERPLAHLPMSYSFGLSVLNSHLSVGAELLLTGQSMMARPFWDFCKTAGATSLSGVPHHYAMLEQLRFQRMELPQLTTLTQAGGKLAADKVAAWVHWCAANNKQFFAMYGQTEATARIAYLPPALASRYPECIGQAIPGGTLSLEADGKPVSTIDTPGELIYQGDNVMMGYASSRADLALPPGSHRLATGDLACRNAEGLFYLVGRQKRFIKLYGQRVSLDEAEQLVARLAGHEAACCGNDDQLQVFVTGEHDLTTLRRDIAGALGVHSRAITVTSIVAIPRTVAGKVDYPALEATP